MLVIQSILRNINFNKINLEDLYLLPLREISNYESSVN